MSGETTKEKINHLIMIYHQQNYFIDRHDSMAEKFINVLLVELTCLSVVFALIIRKGTNINLSLFQIIVIFLFVISFTFSLIQLFFVVRPLSKKAKRKGDSSLINNENKKWIENSSIYYRGIISQRELALEQGEKPFDVYLDSISDDGMTKDLVEQIFILAKYSDFKRKKLELSVKLIIATTIIGVITIMVLMIL